MKKIPKKNSLLFLNKFISQAGITSRRKAVEIIKDGRIKVNGKTVKMPTYIVQKNDTVTFDEEAVQSQEKIYILLNKPKNYITTLSDEQGRKTVVDLVANVGVRLYPVGRLDRDTTGLLLMTNDGDLAQRLAHPRYNIQKTYVVMLDRFLNTADLQIIKQGFPLTDGIIAVDYIGFIPGLVKKNVKIVLHSGKNRIVRRIFEHFGYTVMKLDRVGYAGLTKQGLRVGQWRFLTHTEIKNLQSL